MNQIKMNSREDWLLDSCFYNCFVCGKPFALPPKLDKGRLEGRALCLSIITDKDGSKEDTEERICRTCWVSDLSRYEVENL